MAEMNYMACTIDQEVLFCSYKLQNLLLNLFFAVDPTGFFVGELDGQMVCCIFAIKYDGDHYACLGDWMVLEQYRGRGYGTRVLEAGLAHR